MKKYNFLNPSPGQPKQPGPSRQSVSVARVLIIIGAVGIVLAGVLYWSIHRPFQARLLSPSPEQVTRPQPPERPPAGKPTQVGPQVVKPRVAGTTSRPDGQRELVSPKMEGPTEAGADVEAPLTEGPSEGSPEVAKPSERDQHSPKAAGALVQPEKPVPKPLAKATEPEVLGEERYTLQVATLVLERNALSLKQRLEELGYAPVIRTTTISIPQHRVYYVGELRSREDARRTAQRLNADGFSAKLIEGEDGKFRLEVGSSWNPNRITNLAHELQEKDYPHKIVSRAASTPVHVVRVGAYASRVEALKTLEALKGHGFTPIIVSE